MVKKAVVQLGLTVLWNCPPAFDILLLNFFEHLYATDQSSEVFSAAIKHHYYFLNVIEQGKLT